MRPGLILIGSSVGTLTVFAFWPQMDLSTSGLFFDGTGFPLNSAPLNLVLRWILRVAPFLPALAGLVILAGNRWFGPRVWGLGRRDWAAISLTFLLGPGLLVNRILKTYWGRARPRQVTEFGGDKLFTPPHVWTDQCSANCSFVSGEVSAVTALTVALVMILSANTARMGQSGRRAALGLALCLPVLSAFQRISAGGHFLSDTILAILFTLLVALAVQRTVAPKAR